jgi:type IV pilus assembly protein PilC
MTPPGAEGLPPVPEMAAGVRRRGGFAAASEVPAYCAQHKRIRRDDVIFFANQLAILVDTGVPLAEALDGIAQQSDHAGLKAVIADLSSDVRGGIEFSVALVRHPGIFSNLFVSMMKASEASGTMGRMLQRVSEYMKTDRDIRKQIKGAMLYPACMLSFCVIVVIGILVFVLPRFQRIYAGKGALLPVPTRVLLAISNGLVSYWYVAMTLIITVGLAMHWYLRTDAGKRWLDKLRIALPVIGGMYRKACLARSMRTMATMISSGVTVLDGLAITAKVAGNYFYAAVWTELAERIKEGATLAEHLMGSPIIPHTVAQMISCGERTGKLSTVMNRIAEFCEDDLKTSIRAVTSLIEPLMIIVMGLIIGGIAISLLLPVFTMSRIMVR